MLSAQKQHKKFSRKSYGQFLLAGDIGGTNSAFGVFGIRKGMPELLLSFSFESRKIKNLKNAVNEILKSVKKEHNLSITKACFGVAGIVSDDHKSAKITKLNLDLSENAISRKTGLKKVRFVNDFEAIGYGLNIVNKSQIAVIKKGIKKPKSNMLIIGAGTGLGKCLVVFDKKTGFYKPIASEAGHIEFPAQTEEELRLVEFVKKRKKIGSVSYEQLLSGPGLSNIYAFLRKSKKFPGTKYSKEIEMRGYKPELISRYRKADQTSKKTFEIFSANYAKFARNMALDSLAFGGVYIGGGIAPKNSNIFNRRFIKIFEQDHERAYIFILKKMPIYLISDYSIGLSGAAFAGAEILK